MIKQMQKDIKYVFYLQVLLFTLSVVVFLLAGTFLINGLNQRERVSSDFRYELNLTANNFYHMIQTAHENIDALSSRSMIRDSLYALYTGKNSLDETRNFTQPKYTDGAKVYNNIVYVRRVDDKNRLIAEYPVNFPNDVGFPDREISFMRNEKGCHIVLNHRITHNGLVIGWDQAVFFLCDFSQEHYALLKNVSVTESPLRRKKYPDLADSAPLNNTDYYLSAELNAEKARIETRKNLHMAFLEAFLLILTISLVTYFTIMRLMVRIIRDQKREYEENIRQEKESTISQIIAGLAHEINNVLTGIFGLSDNLEMVPDFPEEGKPLLNSLKESSSRMSQFMRKLTDYSRQNLYGRGDVDIGISLKEISEEWKRLSGSPVRIVVTPPGERITVGIGRKHLQQVISNLLENAAESMAGEGVITMMSERTEPMALPESTRFRDEGIRRWIRIEIKDGGSGIPEEFKTRVFDPFFTTKDGKDGLGLAQASGIISRYGGHIFLESSSPSGTVMTILFPLNGEDAPES